VQPVCARPLPRPKRENAESLERDVLSAGVPLIINAANIFLVTWRQRQAGQDSEIMTRYHVAINRRGNYSRAARVCVRNTFARELSLSLSLSFSLSYGVTRRRMAGQRLGVVCSPLPAR